MFTKFIRFALAMSFMMGGGPQITKITLKPKDIVTGKVYFIREREGERRSDVIIKAREAILEEASSLVKFEDAEPGSYICLVRKENGKFYSRRFRVKQKGSDQVEQIGDDDQFFYYREFSESEIVSKCYPGNDVHAAKTAIMEDDKGLVSFDEAKKKPGTYIGLVKKLGAKYLREFKIDASGSFSQIAPDVDFASLPSTISIGSLHPSQIIGNCFEGTNIEAGKKAIMENAGLAPYKAIKDKTFYICAIQDKLDNFYLISFRWKNSLFQPIGLKYPLDWQLSTLEPSKIVGGCFKGTDIGQAERAIREDNGLIPFEAIEDNVFYTCATKDDLDNFYLTSFVRKSGRFIQIGKEIPLDWRLSTLDRSQIVRGCFKGTDIEQAKLAIREDRGLIPFEAIEDNVYYTCATKDDVDNFYLTNFVRKSGRFIQIGKEIPLDWKFLQKIDEMTCDVAWAHRAGETCLKVDTNDLETAINAYITAFAVGTQMIPIDSHVTDRLDDGIYIKKDMIFEIQNRQIVFAKKISIYPRSPGVRAVEFYQQIRDIMTSEQDKARLDQLVQTPGQRMFVEVRQIGWSVLQEPNMNQISVLNLNLISTSNGGVFDVRYYSLNPNNIDVDPRVRFIYSTPTSSNGLLRPTYTRSYSSRMDASRPPALYAIRHFIYKGQEFIAIPPAALYMDDQGQIFCYYDPEYLYKKHKHDITLSNMRLIRRFNLPLPRPR